jgi:hypothetical protein
VAVAKEKNQATARDSLGAQIGRFLNDVGLGASQILQQNHRLVQESQASLLRTHNMIKDLV